MFSRFDLSYLNEQILWITSGGNIVFFYWNLDGTWSEELEILIHSLHRYETGKPSITRPTFVYGLPFPPIDWFVGLCIFYLILFFLLSLYSVWVSFFFQSVSLSPKYTPIQLKIKSTKPFVQHPWKWKPLVHKYVLKYQGILYAWV